MKKINTLKGTSKTKEDFKKEIEEKIINKIRLISHGENVFINNICPFMSRFETGAGNFIGVVKCIEHKCKCWNIKNKTCGIYRK